MTGTVVVQDTAKVDGGDGPLPGPVGGREDGAATTGDAPSPSARPETGAAVPAAPAARVGRATKGGPLGVVLSFIVGIAVGAAGMCLRP